MADGREAYRQDRLDAEKGVVVTEIGRYFPPTDAVRAAAVLVRGKQIQKRERQTEKLQERSVGVNVF